MSAFHSRSQAGTGLGQRTEPSDDWSPAKNVRVGGYASAAWMGEELAKAAPLLAERALGENGVRAVLQYLLRTATTTAAAATTHPSPSPLPSARPALALTSLDLRHNLLTTAAVVLLADALGGGASSASSAPPAAGGLGAGVCGGMYGGPATATAKRIVGAGVAAGGEETPDHDEDAMAETMMALTMESERGAAADGFQRHASAGADDGAKEGGAKGEEKETAGEWRGEGSRSSRSSSSSRSRSRHGSRLRATLTHLDLGGNEDVGHEGVATLCAALGGGGGNTTLTSLGLSGVGLAAAFRRGDDGGCTEALAELLRADRGLTTLDLSSNGLGAEAIRTFCRVDPRRGWGPRRGAALAAHGSLTALDLGGNPGLFAPLGDDDGAVLLAEALQGQERGRWAPDAARWHWGGRDGLGGKVQPPGAAAAAAEAARMERLSHPLRTLSLRGCALDADGAAGLCALLGGDGGPVRLARLDLSHNAIGDSGAAALAAALRAAARRWKDGAAAARRAAAAEEKEEEKEEEDKEEEGEERRVAPDGSGEEAYSLSEFVDFYGGEEEWKAAPRAGGGGDDGGEAAQEQQEQQQQHSGAWACLRDLRLSHCGVMDAGATALADALRACGARAPPRLDLSGNLVDEQGGRALVGACGAARVHVTTLALGGVLLDDAAACASLCALLGSARRCPTALLLPGCALGGAGCEALARALLGGHGGDGSAPLRTLDLRGNDAGDAGATALAAALRSHAGLRRLDLGCNGIGPSGGEALASALLHNRTLCELELEGNALGDGGVGALSAALRDGLAGFCLTRLDLVRNGAGPGSALAVLRVQLEERALRLAEVGGAEAVRAVEMEAWAAESRDARKAAGARERAEAREAERERESAAAAAAAVAAEL